MLSLTKTDKMTTKKVDTVPAMMQEDFGTSVLITSPAADRFLDKSAKHGTKRYSRPCGGAGGFDDFCERMH